MPFSIAAWSTVLPFSTVISRPSIVSLTVSIPTRILYGRRLIDEVGEDGVILINRDAAERCGQRDARVDGAFAHCDDDVGFLAVVELDGERHRHLEDLAELLDVHDERVAFDSICDFQPRQRRAVDPLVEEAAERPDRTS